MSPICNAKAVTTRCISREELGKYMVPTLDGNSEHVAHA